LYIVITTSQISEVDVCGARESAIEIVRAVKLARITFQNEISTLLALPSRGHRKIVCAYLQMFEMLANAWKYVSIFDLRAN